VPYVDASAASAFRDKRRRMVVGASGIMVELALASAAMWLWTQTEPGLLRAVAFNVMLIGGVSTLFFNGNPLLRFDGYYVFSDALEIPNLTSRSTQYLGYLIQKYLLRSKIAEAPPATAGERRWFVAYGISAFIYRLLIMATIVVFVASQWFFVGVLLAAWALYMMLVLPIWRSLRTLFVGPAFRENRLQAVSITALLLLGLLTLLTSVPVPSYSTAEGVVWVPDSAEIRAAGDGILQAMYVDDGTDVAEGQRLFSLVDPLLESRIRVLESRVRELDARFQSQLREDPGQAQITRAQRDTVYAQLSSERERFDGQQISSPHSGRFLVYNPVGMTGRFYRQGDLLAYVVDYPLDRVVAVVEQDHIGQVRQGVEAVELRLASHIGAVLPSRVLREIPASTRSLPSSALGVQGGGRIAMDPSAQSGVEAFEPFFQFELALPAGRELRNLGERVYVRFHHGRETLARQFWRIARREFLRRFDL
jgi:putative peptide zinc metalloprotease protein